MQRIDFTVAIFIDDLVGYDKGSTLIRGSDPIHTEAACLLAEAKEMMVSREYMPAGQTRN